MRTREPVRISRSPNPFVPGSWEPGRFGLSDALIVKAILIFVALNRGVDYLTPTPVTAAPTPVSESMKTAFPMEVWGYLVLIPATILALGLASRVHFAIWLGHGLLAVIYATLFTSLMAVYVDRPYFDGSRSATALLAPLGLHVLLCIRTGWRPTSWDSLPSEKGKDQ